MTQQTKQVCVELIKDDGMILRQHVGTGKHPDGREFSLSHHMTGRLIVEIGDSYYYINQTSIIDAAFQMHDESAENTPN